MFFLIYHKKAQKERLENMSKKHGFTLIEVVVAMALLAIVLVVVFPAYGLFIKANSTSMGKLSAQEIAQDYVEYMAYEAKKSGTSSVFLEQIQDDANPYGGFDADSVLGDASLYIKTTEEYEASITFQSDYKLIRVTITTAGSKQTFETVEWLNYDGD